jgi:acyl-CoA reductase-like NAD-dependent aldehyde dehydrogenase
MIEVPIWRRGRPQKSLDTRRLTSYRGQEVAQVYQASALIVQRTVSDLRACPPLYGDDLRPVWAMIAKAGQILAEAELGGCTPEAHAELVTRATGTPITATRQALRDLAAAMTRIEEALRWQAPGGDLALLRQNRLTLIDGRTCAWVPVGRVLGFIAPSNHPTVHFTWVMALALGWSVALRPGADDPLTPWRLALALEAAGLPMERLAILPGSHDLVPALVEACDRTIAYGGTALAERLGRDARVLFNGPGSSKVVVEPPLDLDAAAAFLVGSILQDAGRKCTCTSSVVLWGENAELVKRVQAGLAEVPLLDPLDAAAQVPAWRDQTQVEQVPAEVAQHDGLLFVRPALVACADPSAPPFGLELPTPWATAVQLSRSADPMPVLRESLAVTLLSRDERLRASCLFEPSILKVYVGPIYPSDFEPGAPHHGRLSEFLFTSKAHQEVNVPWI